MTILIFLPNTLLARIKFLYRPVLSRGTWFLYLSRNDRKQEISCPTLPWWDSHRRGSGKSIEGKGQEIYVWLLITCVATSKLFRFLGKCFPDFNMHVLPSAYWRSCLYAHPASGAPSGAWESTLLSSSTWSWCCWLMNPTRGVALDHSSLI